MLIDTHSHINFFSFNEDRGEVIKRSLDNNVWMINVGINLKTSQEVVAISQEYPVGVYAAIGLHPIDLDTGLVKAKFSEEEGNHLEKDFDYQKYKQLAENHKVVAIGEVGLDYYWKPKTTGKMEQFKQKQKDLLSKELKLAQELNLPIIFHCRMAHEDLIEILNTKHLIPNTNLRGVIHCFTGTWEQAQKYMELGFYLGFNGIIFKLNLDEIIKKTPLERILIETDCPYLPPIEFKGQRNEPMYVKYIAKRIAELKGVDIETIAKITTKNAKLLFSLNNLG
ncbi:MAG: TatD family hydrolase [Patescibacteria group bacterium]|nr:TatD family hydrolase [Patescibacteria group bacterium]MBU1877277.1 TatD family hydrolase [Patescibacteria group bacterium]